MDRKSRTSFFTNMVVSRRGQTLVLALIILFMLVFLGGLFVTLIARNLARTRRSGQTLTAEYLAETGVRYASDQLTYSLDGADWRPVPNYPDVIRNLNGDNITTPVKPNLSDPDYDWLTKGYCRFTYGDGRFLIRVTYEPKFGDPISKYIKIESIGRVGVVDENDPTTLDLKQPLRLRAERVAYKAIGITDYSRFITNQDRRTEAFGLGVPAYTQPNGLKQAFTTQYGDVSDYNGDTIPEPHGGSIRVNGNLTWYGKNFIWLDAKHNEAVEVAGDISHAVEWSGGGNGPTPESTMVYLNPDRTISGWRTNLLLRQSSDPYFDTSTDNPSASVGVYRDGRPEGDVGVTIAGVLHRRPRGIQRLDPPLLDVTGPTGGTGRYRELTRNSGEWLPPASTGGTWYNTGFYGWGKGLYINNRDDLQTESDLKTLRDDWMNPGESQNWVGPYYNPPGIIMVLTPYDLDNDDGDNNPMTGKPDIILMESNTSGAKFNWYDKNGGIITPGAGQMVMPYPENGIIFAEGNIRIKGMLAPHKQLTVVSAGTIYVEGNVLKCGLKDDGTPMLPTDPKDSSIALLATDYVAVNATQFFGPAPESQTPGSWRPEMGGFDASVDHPLSFDFAFGMDPSAWYGTMPVCAYVRHAADGGSAYMNMTVNQFGAGADPGDPTDQWYGFYKFDMQPWSTLIPPAQPARQYIYPMADIDAAATVFPVPPNSPTDQSNLVAVQTYPIWEHQVFTIFPLSNPPRPDQNYALNIFPGSSNQIGFRLDQNIAKADYLLSRFAVQPCDIRVEAMLYAQNGSFYVISGAPFNPDPGDSRNEFLKGNAAVSGRLARMGIDERWPFYGEPLDVRLIINGSVSENVSAPIADQAAWMSAWGWIPPSHGSSPLPADEVIGYRSPLDPENSETVAGTSALPVRQRGLSIIYDDMLSYPKVPTVATDRTKDVQIRRDLYLRPLAVTPKLPVSSQTIFFGRPT